MAWATSLIEYDAAWRGYCRANGIGPSASGGVTRARHEELKRLYATPQTSTPPG